VKAPAAQFRQAATDSMPAPLPYVPLTQFTHDPEDM
jgi:hypothetical protein